MHRRKEEWALGASRAHISTEERWTRRWPGPLFLVVIAALLLGSSSFSSGKTGSVSVVGDRTRVSVPRTTQSEAEAQQPLFSDSFSNEASLNPALWTTDTPLLKALARSNGFLIHPAWKEPLIRFSASGMTIQGAAGVYQFTGIQSVLMIAPPFTLRATVLASTAHGNPFELYLMSGDMRELLSVTGNINPRNLGYYGIGISSQGPPGSAPARGTLYARPAIDEWYTITVIVNSAGSASATFSSPGGIVLGSRRGMDLGTGPFYVLLTQYEGLPNSGAGPNSATWKGVWVSRQANTPLPSQGGPAENRGPSITPTYANRNALPREGRRGPSRQSSSGIWIARVEPSVSETTAGRIELEWNSGSARNCRLSVFPSVENLAQGASMPVACAGTDARWWASVPARLPRLGNSTRAPIRYTFTIVGDSGTLRNANALSVYVLPRSLYGKSGSAFSSLANTPVLSPKPLACRFNIGCWFQFGLSDGKAEWGPNSFSMSGGPANAGGVAMAGIVGYNFSIGADYDSLTADYGPFSNVPSDYVEYLSVQPQPITLVSLQACGAIEGGSGVGYRVTVGDSARDSFISTLQQKTCAHLVAGVGGEVVQGALEYLQRLANAGKLTNDAAGMAITLLNQTKDHITISAKLLRLLNDLEVSPVAGSVDSVTAPSWTPRVGAGCAYTLTVAPVAALTTLGAGVGAAELTIAQTSVVISGIAVPGRGEAMPCGSR